MLPQRIPQIEAETDLGLASTQKQDTLHH